MTGAKIIDGVSLGLFPGERSTTQATGLLGMARSWVERYRQRKALSRLDDRMLRDLGLSQADAYLEVEKPFWRA